MASTLPLFRQADLERLRRQRAELLDRMSRKRPHAHDRIVLLGRLTRITAEILALESNRQGGDHGP